MTDRLIDELRKNCKQPSVVYCIDNYQILSSRRATTLALRRRRHLGYVSVHALDAYPEPGQIGWRDATEEFITSRVDETSGTTQFGIRLANGQVRWS